MKPTRVALAVACVVVLVAIPVIVIGRAPDSVHIPVEKPHEGGKPKESGEFSHWEHNQYYCYTCHPSLFEQELKGFTHEDMDQGKYCGACHNGKLAFSPDEVDCETCHRK